MGLDYVKILNSILVGALAILLVILAILLVALFVVKWLLLVF